ncbi:MAG: tetratricopeptide repeat protein [Candidatus Eisenbacteria bacterium]|nr:tetratricopeptide repeat protein [Candidatus Eisenbacteria bacterium]
MIHPPPGAGRALLALACAAALCGPAPSARAGGGDAVLRFRGPRPQKVWELGSPPRVVLDFPADAKVEADPGANRLRRAQVRDLDGAHPRLILELPRSAPYWVSWRDSAGVLLLAGGPAPAPATPASSVAGPRSGAAPATARGRSAGPAAIRAPAPPPKSGVAGRRAHDTRTVTSRAPDAPVRTALARGDAVAAAAALDSCARFLSADSAAALYARLALLEWALHAAPDGVEGHARRALQLGAESVSLDLLLGRVLDRTGRTDEAARWYRRATQITPDPESKDDARRTAYFQWADAQYRLAGPEDALAAYVEAMAAYPAAPERPWSLHQCAKLETRLGRAQAAAARLQELETHHPDDYWTAQARARAGSAARMTSR